MVGIRQRCFTMLSPPRSKRYSDN